DMEYRHGIPPQSREGGELVGAAGFEPTTPSPPDWCANQAAPRSDYSMMGRMGPGGTRRRRTIVAGPRRSNREFGVIFFRRAPPQAGLSGPSAHRAIP